MKLPQSFKNEYKQKIILAVLMPIFWVTCMTQVYPISAICIYFLALTFFTILVNTYERLKTTTAASPPASKNSKASAATNHLTAKNRPNSILHAQKLSGSDPQPKPPSSSPTALRKSKL